MIQSLRLQQFRSYTDDSFEFGESVNIIVGPNASGKTNLLEALMMVARAKSYRGGDDELIMHGHDWARLDAHISGQERIVKLQCKEAAGSIEKTTSVDGKVYRRLPGNAIVPFILFEPNHLQLMHGGPELRRELIDDLLEQLVAEFGSVRRHYKRVLLQRNSLLKQRPTKQDLFVWNLRLSELGGKIAQERLKLIDELSQQISSIYKELSSSKDDLRAAYHSKCSLDNYGSSLLKRLESETSVDIERGFTGSGPHRDDVLFTLNDHPADQTASRGEVRTGVLAIKIASLKHLQKVHDHKPFLLLDDVFSELDGGRRRALTDFLKDHQVFITTTDADIVVQHFIDSCTIIPMG
jgi:DNA replication and repair protein RecF